DNPDVHPFPTRRSSDLLRILHDDLGNQPGIHEAVIRVYQDSFASSIFAPACDVDDVLEVALRGHIRRLRRGGENVDTKHRGLAHRQAVAVRWPLRLESFSLVARSRSKRFPGPSFRKGSRA